MKMENKFSPRSMRLRGENSYIFYFLITQLYPLLVCSNKVLFYSNLWIYLIKKTTCKQCLSTFPGDFPHFKPNYEAFYTNILVLSKVQRWYIRCLWCNINHILGHLKAKGRQGKKGKKKEGEKWTSKFYQARHKKKVQSPTSWPEAVWMYSQPTV